MPADCSGIEENLCAHEARYPCCFRIPLVPADEYADRSVSGLEYSKACGLSWLVAMTIDLGGSAAKRLTRSEVVFLVVKRIVGDVHLPIDTEHLAVRIDNRCGIVVHAWTALLENWDDDDEFQFSRQPLHTLYGWPRN